MKLNNRGAASILVVLIIVVLATFGGVALTAGWTNKQLSIKAAQSKADYYTLDSAAEEVLAETDSLLYSAAQEAQVFLSGLSSVSDISLLEDDEKLTPLFDKQTDYIESAALKTKKIQEIFARIYFYRSALLLETYAGEKGLAVLYSEAFESPQDFLDPGKDMPRAGDIMISFTVSQGTEPGQKNLDVKIAPEAPETIIKISDSDAWRTDFSIESKSGAARYQIYSWKLRQNPIDSEGEKPKFG